MSNPLPPKVNSRSLNASTVAHSAKLVIKVEEDPSPQFSGNSSVEVIEKPASALKCTGFKRCIASKICTKRSAISDVSFEMNFRVVSIMNSVSNQTRG